MKQLYTNYSFTPSDEVLNYIRLFAYNYDSISLATGSRLPASR